ncbi:hypothetical protein [Burkholderia pseudomultivorans]|uniref:hypothetical protein n=1 Tax=Burkholderia pseudomultivorans TaxID=1207504 RepID=UPI000B2AFA1A|nr:hypothetical protein [Burkholderia pseudomultivorans]
MIDVDTHKFWIGVLVSCVALQGCSERKTLTAAELQAAIDSCYAAGGAPKPVYDKEDPIRVFRLDCQKAAPIVSASEVQRGAE